MTKKRSAIHQRTVPSFLKSPLSTKERLHESYQLSVNVKIIKAKLFFIKQLI